VVDSLNIYDFSVSRRKRNPTSLKLLDDHWDVEFCDVKSAEVRFADKIQKTARYLAECWFVSYVVVRYSDAVRIGTRGFLGSEKESGLILVLNTKMRFSWEDDILECRLVFGSEPHTCTIPADHIVAIHSPELETQLVVAGNPESKEPPAPKESRPDPAKDAEPQTETGSKVVQVDFSKKKK